METAILDQVQEVQKGTIELSIESISYFNQIRKWTKFFSILGFLFIGLVIVGGIAISLFFSKFDQSGGKIPFVAMLLMYIVMAVIFFFPVLYMFNFSKSAKSAIENNNSYDLSIALKNLKSHFKYIGIFTIVILSIYIFAGVVILITKFVM